MAVHFEFYAPDSWEEACARVAEFGTDARPLAGGTDLMILIERGQIAPQQVVSLARIPGWNALSLNGSLKIGAGTTYRQIERTRELYGAHRALVEAARQVGGVQVRTVATVAGNICNASPAADAVPPLLVMEAALELCGQDSARTVAADSFITGPRETALRPGELVRAIHVPALPPRTATIFLKAGRRKAMEISVVGVAVRLTLAPDRDVIEIGRIALNAVAPRPLRAYGAESALTGRPLTPELLDEAADRAVAVTEPISDVRASADFRRHLTRVMVRQALAQCWQQLTEPQ